MTPTPVAPALNLRRKSVLLAAAAISLVCPLLLAQNAAPAATPAVPAFDVATIKPHAPGTPAPFFGITNTPDGVQAYQASLTALLQYAYGLKNGNQVSGVPDWAKTEQFDVQAKMSAADIAEMQKLSFPEGMARREPMMQALLAERFHLKVHSETRQVPTFELVVAKANGKLIDAATDTSPTLKKGKDGTLLMNLAQQRKDTSVWQGYSMASLADFLSAPYSGVGRPVQNKTGLAGTYDFTLNWSVYTAQVMVRDGVAVGSAAGDDAPSIFQALQDVGLKLQPATGPMEMIVIDRADHPTAD